MNIQSGLSLFIYILISMIAYADSNPSSDTASEMIGDWVSVDFVKEIQQFNPDQRLFSQALFLKGLFFENRSVVWCFSENNRPGKYKWQPGRILVTPNRPALYQLKTINGVQYLFYEWISGDVLLRGMKPQYYVLKRGKIDDRYKEVSPSNSAAQKESIDHVALYDDVRNKDLSRIRQAIENELMRSLQFNQGTVWPEQSLGGNTIESFSQELINSAMYPGLGVRRLHEAGVTGQGVNVAIIDQPLCNDHPEYQGKIAAYHNLCNGSETSMHGPAVMSLLAGNKCGTAPGVRVFYAAAPSWTKDAKYYAQAMEWIIEQNRQLPVGRKIRVVSVSAMPSGPDSPFEKNNDLWDQACRNAQAEGILVLDCTQHHGFIKPAHFRIAPTDNPAFCDPGFPGRSWRLPLEEGTLFVPTCPRTTAEERVKGTCTYIYWGKGGLSWAIPYAAGVLAMGWQVWPEATGEQMKQLLLESAYTNGKEANIINPPRFIMKVKKAKNNASKRAL